ncbi:MAG: RNA polymerase sigma factor [Phycisphaerales bacterium]
MLKPRDFSDTRPSLLVELRRIALGIPDLPAIGTMEDAPWRRFFNMYAPAVYRVALHRRLPPTDAEDIVQQVMMAVLGHIGGFEYETSRGRFRAWILRITENKIKDLARRQRPRERGGDAAEDEAVGADEGEGVWEAEWRMQDLLYCLDQVEGDIAPRRMEAFRLYVLQGVPAAEVARELGMQIGHVYVTRSQVLRMVRQKMEALAEAEEKRSEDRP